MSLLKFYLFIYFFYLVCHDPKQTVTQVPQSACADSFSLVFSVQVYIYMVSVSPRT